MLRNPRLVKMMTHLKKRFPNIELRRVEKMQRYELYVCGGITGTFNPEYCELYGYFRHYRHIDKFKFMPITPNGLWREYTDKLDLFDVTLKIYEHLDGAYKLNYMETF